MADWFSVRPTSGNGSGSVTVTCPASAASHSGSITVRTASGLSKSVSLTKEGLTENEVKVASSGYTSPDRHPYISVKCQYAAASTLTVSCIQNVVLMSNVQTTVRYLCTISVGSTTSAQSTNDSYVIGTVISSAVIGVTPTQDNTYAYTY